MLCNIVITMGKYILGVVHVIGNIRTEKNNTSRTMYKLNFNRELHVYIIAMR
jgi:hypothetical protein